MKKFTKICLALFFIFFVGSVLTFQFFVKGISLNNGLVFNFSPLGYTGLVFLALTLIFGTILYIKFLKNQSFTNTLFFATIPITFFYIVLILLLVNLTQTTKQDLQFVKVALRLNQLNFTFYLWVVVISIVYVIILFVTYKLLCRPLKKVEKAVYRLSDGKVNNMILVGGSKQFKEIEYGLNKINENYKQKENIIKQTNLEFEKFIPKQFLKFFGKNNILELELGNQVQKEVTTMFCEIKNSTNLSTSLSLEENFNFINSYLNLISPLIRKFGGFVDKYLGDGILAVFSTPESALNCSKSIFSAIETKNAHEQKLPDMTVGISINTGEVIFGVVGEEARKSLTVISDGVNIASKMCEINNFFSTSVVFSKRTLNALPYGFPIYYRYIGTLKDKNNELVSIFENLDVYERTKREKLHKTKQEFESAVRLYYNQDYEKAMQGFANVLNKVKQDGPAYVYYNLCQAKLKEK